MTDKRHQFEQEALAHLNAAYNLARWLCRSTTDADNVVQEALLLADRSFDTRRGASGWLRKLRVVWRAYSARASGVEPCATVRRIGKPV